MAAPSDDELEALSSPRIVAPGGETMPDPEEAVVERAQVILNEANDGQSFSTVSEDGVATETPVVAKYERITAQQKIDFMAHVLGGHEYKVTYMIFGTTEVTFRVLTPVKEQFLADLVSFDVENGLVDKGRKKLQYYKYAMAMSLYSMGGMKQDVFPQVSEANSARNTYNAWLASEPGGRYRVLDQLYHRFVTELDEMYRRADDPDFWPTPS